jgi:hypothetical protein
MELGVQRRQDAEQLEDGSSVGVEPRVVVDRRRMPGQVRRRPVVVPGLADSTASNPRRIFIGRSPSHPPFAQVESVEVCCFPYSLSTPSTCVLHREESPVSSVARIESTTPFGRWSWRYGVAPSELDRCGRRQEAGFGKRTGSVPRLAERLPPNRSEPKPTEPAAVAPPKYGDARWINRSRTKPKTKRWI